MTKLFLLIALTGILSFSPLAVSTAAFAEDAHAESDIDQNQEQDQEMWVEDEPADIENSDLYDSEGEESPEPQE